MKKFIKPAILFLGSFLVVNAAMFGFLTLTRPPHDDIAAATDSTAADSSATESLAAADTLRPVEFDSTAMAAGPSVLSDSPAVFADLPVTAAETLLTTEANGQIDSFLTDAASIESQPTPVAETKPPAAPVAAAEAINAANLPDDPAELTKLAKLLDSMKPDDAAAIAARLNTDQIIALVMRMKNRNGGKMLAALPVDKAALVAARMSQTAARGKNGS